MRLFNVCLVAMLALAVSAKHHKHSKRKQHIEAELDDNPHPNSAKRKEATHDTAAKRSGAKHHRTAKRTETTHDPAAKIREARRKGAITQTRSSSHTLNRPKMIKYHVVADAQMKAHISKCPPRYNLMCRDQACNYTCAEVFTKGNCRDANLLACDSSDYVCDCFTSWGYFREHSGTTNCIHKNNPVCKAARAISCRKNEQALCRGYDTNCLVQTCVHFLMNKTEPKNICVWREQDDFLCAKENQTCECANGYVYDVLKNMTCVLPEGCTQCPANSKLMCRNKACNRTCEQVSTLGNCPDGDVFACNRSEYVCDCANSLGYFRENSNSTKCIHKDDAHCKSARIKSCGVNNIALCEGYDTNCLAKTCINYYVNKTERANMCTWNETAELSCAIDKQVCECVNGYLYDVLKAKCVLPKDCTPYWWKDAATEYRVKDLTHVAVKTGEDVHGGPVVVMRYNLDAKTTLIGKLRFISNNDQPAWPIAVDKSNEFQLLPDTEEYKKVEILYALPGFIYWEHHTKNDGNKLPSNALLAGYVNGKPQYVGKAPYKGNAIHTTPGRVEDGILTIGYDYNPYTYEEFDVACVTRPIPASYQVKKNLE